MAQMFDRDRTFDDASAYGSERWVAATLGSSTDWLRKNRPVLESEGLPQIDRLIGLTLKDDVKAFLARRRRVPDPEPRSTGARYDHL
jgi:hypothetical protein